MLRTLRKACCKWVSVRSANKTIVVAAKDGIRYTVPQRIHSESMEDELTIRFRVDGVFEDRYINVWAGEKRLVHKRRPILVPGEMESVLVKKSDLLACGNIEELTVCLEEVR